MLFYLFREIFGLVSFNFKTYSEGAHSCEVIGGGTKISVVRGDYIPEDYMFKMDGKAAYKVITQKLPIFLSDFFKASGITCFGDADITVPHQASPLALKNIQKKFSIPPKKMIYTLDRRGNQIASSIPFALIEALEKKQLTEGKSVILFGTSAGLSIGIALLKI